MKSIITVLLLNLLLVGNSDAASWTKLQDNKHAELMLDKQSVATSGKHQKAWVKIQYKTMQTNLEYPDKQYNNAKLLWYFNCKEQKAASVQVYQLLDDEQVFSAAIEVKRARFIEPVPETEIDLAMHYACKQKARREAAIVKKEAAKKVAANNPEKEVASGKGATKVEEKKKAVIPEKVVVKNDKEEKSPDSMVEVKKDKEDKKDSKHKDEKTDKSKKKALKKAKKKKKAQWKYKGKKGPEFWGDLSPDYASCKAGRNQSPINITNTIKTNPKPIKTFQRFPVKEILNNGHTVQANFKPGNMLMVDGEMYQMKQVHFHTPSENTIDGRSFPLEAHFVHADPKGNLAVLAVMYEEGTENKALTKLWKQMPKRKGKPKKFKTKVLASELVPRKKEFYRFSGSLTTPPCSEGVIWIVMKSFMSASQSQIDAFKKVIRHDNNRPVQPLNGRMVIE